MRDKKRLGVFLIFLLLLSGVCYGLAVAGITVGGGMT
jgi:hypothetical protein